MTSVKTVILVEDDPDDRDLFYQLFSSRDDLNLLPSVENGVELINYLHEVSMNDQLPDLIILDQNMPKMNGKQTLAFLKSHNLFASIATVIYSTYTDSNLVHECIGLGANMVALKPIDHEGYEKMMDDFLKLL
jgi:DNA-binding NarL/FixJ family response regulator